ncbi:MAG: SCO family protein [Alphaproteobacteria bacterium]|nr:SCO family protein [Alphaproteobacteria bacterium]
MRLSPLILSALLGFTACNGEPSSPPADAPPASTHEALPAAAADPGSSIYLLDLPLRDHNGETIALDVHRGHPTLVAMFYATCPSACPMLIKDLQTLEAALSPEEQASLRVLLVSLDPATDDRDALAEVVERHALDGARWTLAAPEPERVRDLAAVLGVSYRRLESGEFNHSSLITLLDAEGRPVKQLEGLRQDAAPLVDALRAL